MVAPVAFKARICAAMRRISDPTTPRAKSLRPVSACSIGGNRGDRSMVLMGARSVDELLNLKRLCLGGEDFCQMGFSFGEDFR